MIILLFAAIIGGITSAVVVAASFGVITGILMAPFGGSALALAAGLLIAYQNSGRSHALDLDQGITDQVGALRTLLDTTQTGGEIPNPREAQNWAA